MTERYSWRARVHDASSDQDGSCLSHHLFFILFDVDDYTPDCPNMMLVMYVETFIYQVEKKEEYCRHQDINARRP